MAEFGKWDVIGEIGEGGQGKVSRVLDTSVTNISKKAIQKSHSAIVDLHLPYKKDPDTVNFYKE